MLSRICNSDFAEHEMMSSWFMGYPVDETVVQDLSNYADSIIGAWESGKRMTGLVQTQFSYVRPHLAAVHQAAPCADK